MYTLPPDIISLFCCCCKYNIHLLILASDGQFESAVRGADSDDVQVGDPGQNFILHNLDLRLFLSSYFVAVV